MSDAGGELVGFAYGEYLEGDPPRSLGYRLLTADEGEPWGAEVEALARRLQAAPYPDHWPEADLFCSVLLGDGRRLVALARYGLCDHTPGHRRGGIELVGVVAPGDLGPAEALAIYRWLRQWRTAAEDPGGLQGHFPLADVLAAAPAPPGGMPSPVLPVRLWQEGVLLFAASAPADPDQHLRLLEQAVGPTWQWLPLVGPDCPLECYARRGPLVAWTAHLTGVALQLNHKPLELAGSRAVARGRAIHSPWPAVLAGSLAFLLLVLLGANFWSLSRLHEKLASAPAAQAAPPSPKPSHEKPAPGSAEVPQAGTAGRDRFVTALGRLVREESGGKEWPDERQVLLGHYHRLVEKDEGLRVGEGDEQAQLTVAAVSVLAGRSADRIEETVRKALSDKGFSDKLIQAACEHIHEQFVHDVKRGP
jgi:hypothetical protein